MSKAVNQYKRVINKAGDLLEAIDKLYLEIEENPTNLLTSYEDLLLKDIKLDIDALLKLDIKYFWSEGGA